VGALAVDHAAKLYGLAIDRQRTVQHIFERFAIDLVCAIRANQAQAFGAAANPLALRIRIAASGGIVVVPLVVRDCLRGRFHDTHAEHG
jgi:hypothetical protein